MAGVPARYSRNLEALTAEDVALLGSKTAAVVGCGGLGGYLLEYLARLGVGTLLAVDPDVFQESNLNRQLLCLEANLGAGKAEEAARRAAAVNSLVACRALSVRLDADNGPELLRGADVVLDALDGIASRRALQAAAEALGVPLVHGAVAGWYGQVCVVFPGDRTLDLVYGRAAADTGAEARLGNLSFGPAAVAAFQAAEAVKLLVGKGEVLRRKLLTIDLLRNEHETTELAPRAGKEAAV